MDLPPNARSVADIPDDFDPQPLGQRSTLIERILALAPTADFSDPSWGRIVTPAYAIEVNIGDSETVDSIMLHVRGGDAAVGFVAELLDHLGLRAIDVQAGDFFDVDAAQASFSKWRAYRDRVIQPER